MNCKEASERLSAFLDGELSSSESALMEAHLDGCAKCREEYRILSDTLAFVDQWNVGPCPAELRKRIHTRISNSESADPASREVRPGYLGIFYFLRYAAAIFLGVLVGMFGLGLIGSKPTGEKLGAQEEKALSELQMEKFDDLPKGSLGETYLDLLAKKK